MSLKNLTQSKHSNAERSWFASLMISGKISKEQYSVYLKQQFECYSALEKRLDSMVDSKLRIPDNLKRADRIMKDLKELSLNPDNIPIFETTQNYVDYITSKCKDDVIYAHVYVRYLGDLKGGQIIAKKVPGAGKYYQFTDPEILEAFIRSQLSQEEEFVEECNRCFDSAIGLFKDLQTHLS